MTKRYGMSNETGAFIDKQIDKEYTDDEIIDLLNEQHERIQVLKASNGEMEDYLARLEEKNEQLKSTINTLTHDNTKMKKVLNTTKNENEQIKQVIKEAYQTERTELGKSVLKQLMETIQ